MGTSEGEMIDSDLFERATDLWERARDKAEKIYEDQSPASPVSFASFVPEEFQKRLRSSSWIPKHLIEPLTDYFSKLEMTETSSLSLADLNLIGTMRKKNPSRIHCIRFRICQLRRFER